MRRIGIPVINVSPGSKADDEESLKHTIEAPYSQPDASIQVTYAAKLMSAARFTVLRQR